MSDSEAGPGGGTQAPLDALIQAPDARLIAGRYRLIRELGRGGTGIVWLADDQIVLRQVAVKELRPPADLAAPERDTFVQRALTEARSAARIHHANAVTLFDVVPASGSGGATYLIMEFVDGSSLAYYIGSHGPLPASRVATLGLQMLSVLEAAHQLGIVHRDIKPANILLSGDQVKLTDFGIAHTIGDTRLTTSGIMGTQAYMAPELFDGAPITPAADMWSLGATLFAAACGRGPFERDNAAATMRAVLVDPLPAPACPPALAEAITGLLQRDPARRVATPQAHELLQAAASAYASPAAMTPARPGPEQRAGAGPASDLSSSPEARPGARASLPTVPATLPASSPTGTRVLTGRRPRRRPVIITAVTAAALVIAAAIIVPVLLLRGSPAHQTATLNDPGGVDAKAVAFSPDGKTLAVGDVDGSTYLWDVATGRRFAVLTDPAGSNAVNAVAFSPDGKTLAVGDVDDNTYLWDVATRQITAAPNDGGLSVDSVAFSPDGQTLVAGDQNGRIYLWNVASQASGILTDPGNSSEVDSVAFSPDGQTLAAGDADGSTYLWDIATGQLTATLTGPAGKLGVTSVAFSPDGQALAAGDHDHSTYLWNVASQRLTATLTDPHGISVSSVAFSPDGQTLAAGDHDHSTYLWDVASRRLTATLTDPHGISVSSVAFSPDGQTLAAADYEGSAFLWDTGGG